MENNTIDQAQIDAWKAQHPGGVFALSVAGKKAYLKTPGRKELGAAMSLSKGDAFKMNEIILENCWLGGDVEIKTDDRLFMSACQKLDVLIEFEEAEIKKL